MIEEHVAISPPDGVLVWDEDPYADDILRHPEPYYSVLRARGPFVYIPRYSILACGRYKETSEILLDWEHFVSSRGIGLTDFKYAEPWRSPSIILEADPPYHAKRRAAIARALSPRPELKPAFQAAAEDLVDELLERGTFDAVSDLALAYPATVFPRALGMTEIDRGRLIDYGGIVFNATGPDNALRRESLAKIPDTVPWIAERCERKQLGSNGFGARIYAAADAGEITEDEAAMLVRSLLSAGIDTTVAGIGSAIWCLASYPDQFERLKADPRLAWPAFQETLRFASPVHSFYRTASQDTEVSGVAIRQDTKILCVVGSANLDPGYWPDAQCFDIGRKSGGHLSFGFGIHGCVGRGIARLEAEALLTAVANKVRSIQLAGEPVWRPGNELHALDSLPVTFMPK